MSIGLWKGLIQQTKQSLHDKENIFHNKGTLLISYANVRASPEGLLWATLICIGPILAHAIIIASNIGHLAKIHKVFHLQKLVQVYKLWYK